MIKFVAAVIALSIFAYLAHYWIAGYYFDIPFLDFI